MSLQSIAIHLPQFHPIPENDRWWGKGFTEWTNVTKAKPLFKGHYQPHLPSDLGFYDLRLEEARIAQAKLASAYGIYGFCYYHYWFNGKRVLNRPLDDMLKTKTPDFPFMLCWANENWTRVWDGGDKEILMKQHYSLEDDKNHIRFLCEQFFIDKRYIRVGGKPFVLIYRPSLFPDIKATLDCWRKEALSLGIGELYIGFMSNFNFKEDPKKTGFDCRVDFQPDLWNLPDQEFPPLNEKIKTRLRIQKSAYYKNKIVSYPKYVDKVLSNLKVEEYVYPGITPGWDNSSRRKDFATLFKDANPHDYERWLMQIKKEYANKDTFVFINAWNEWAEGNHLEPCQKWGRQYLEATKKVLCDNSSLVKV